MRNACVPRQLPGESWKPVSGFPSYAVSDMGRVKRLDPSPWIITQTTRPYGYRTVTLGKGTLRFVHRLVAFAFVPVVIGKPHIDHIDGNASNNVPSNLRWVTPTENMRAAFERHGGHWASSVTAYKTPILRLDAATGAEVRFESLTQAANDINERTVANGGVAKPTQLMIGNICHARDRLKVAYGHYWCSPKRRLPRAIIRAHLGLPG